MSVVNANTSLRHLKIKGAVRRPLHCFDLGGRSAPLLTALERPHLYGYTWNKHLGSDIQLERKKVMFEYVEIRNQANYPNPTKPQPGDQQ